MSEPAHLTNKRGAARYLGCSVGYVERLMREGGLPFARFTPGGPVRFRYSDLAEYVERRVQRVANTRWASRFFPTTEC